MNPHIRNCHINEKIKTPGSVEDNKSIRMRKTKERQGQDDVTTFARPKSASLTDPLASTNILAHLISLQEK